MFTTDTERFGGRAVLLLAHVAGMIDLVALPVWVGAALIGQYGFAPPLAGAMVTAYLAAAVVASLWFGPRFERHAPGRAAALGYGVAALAFAALAQVSAPPVMLALHAVAGFGAGAALSFVHGTIGRSAQPHRLFAVVSLGLGVSAIAFLGAAQALVPVQGGPLLFLMFAGLMLGAALATGLAFPRAGGQGAASTVRAAHAPAAPIPAPVWWAVAGLTLMAVTQSMVFSFVERIGAERGFGERVLVVLVAMGFVNLLPPVLAALLERRLTALAVARTGAVAQAVLAAVLAFGSGFAPYAGAAVVFVAVMIFTHTFVFGWLSRHDTSGRAVALTPAMLMSGAAIGPIAAGGLVAGFGSASLGVAAVVVGLFSFFCYRRAAALAAATAVAAAAPAGAAPVSLT